MITDRWIPLCGLVVLVVAFDIAAAIFSFESFRHDTVAIGIVIGAAFGQIATTAVATSMLPGSLVLRVAMGTAATVLVAAAMALHLRDAATNVPFVIAAAGCCQWLIYQVPLTSFRLNGWVIDWCEQQAPTSVQETQFGIRQIFAWTSIVAILLAASRFVYGFASDVQKANATDWSIFGILSLGNSVLALPLMWGIFVRHRGCLWTCGSLLWMVVVTPLQLWMIHRAVTLGPDEEWIFVTVNVVQTLVVLSLLGAMRFAGLRLHRTEP